MSNCVNQVFDGRCQWCRGFWRETLKSLKILAYTPVVILTARDSQGYVAPEQTGDMPRLTQTIYRGETSRGRHSGEPRGNDV